MFEGIIFVTSLSLLSGRTRHIRPYKSSRVLLRRRLTPQTLNPTPKTFRQRGVEKAPLPHALLFQASGHLLANFGLRAFGFRRVYGGGVGAGGGGSGRFRGGLGVV